MKVGIYAKYISLVYLSCFLLLSGSVKEMSFLCQSVSGQLIGCVGFQIEQLYKLKRICKIAGEKILVVPSC